MQLEEVTEGELVVPGKLAKLLRIDAEEIAWTIELDESALKRRSSLHAPGPQRRLSYLSKYLYELNKRLHMIYFHAPNDAIKEHFECLPMHS
ncbi:hypothetical protein [Sneathiella limimaris]|uniref:hypothetical protein n=1 Tax=Sneathiella limimaris TaxID=1964213 RepID=UPI00146B0537|nr:hypothetical protein [Sneathiella limimaris]